MKKLKFCPIASIGIFASSPAALAQDDLVELTESCRTALVRTTGD